MYTYIYIYSFVGRCWQQGGQGPKDWDLISILVRYACVMIAFIYVCMYIYIYAYVSINMYMYMCVYMRAALPSLT